MALRVHADSILVRFRCGLAGRAQRLSSESLLTLSLVSKGDSDGVRSSRNAGFVATFFMRGQQTAFTV